MQIKKPPKYLSTDHDPLFRFNRWKANLSILEIDEIKTVPYIPISHPFIERLIGSARREYLDHLFFWNERDLTHKLEQFKQYYNNERAHTALNRATPAQKASSTINNVIPIDNYRWKSTARNLFQLPIAV